MAMDTSECFKICVQAEELRLGEMLCMEFRDSKFWSVCLDLQCCKVKDGRVVLESEKGRNSFSNSSFPESHASLAGFS